MYGHHEKKATPRKLASKTFPLEMLCEWEGAMIHGETGELIKYLHLWKNTKYWDAWGIWFGNEISRLIQGMKGHVKCTNKMSFIKKEEVPQNIFREVTYSRVVCDVRERKSEKKITRLKSRRDIIKYPGNSRTRTENLLTVKLLLNSVISNLGEKLWR